MHSHVQVHEDFSCPICLTVYYQPVQIKTCHHKFCRGCLFDAAFLSGSKKCPLCRVPYKDILLNQLPQLANQAEARYPNLVAQKKKTVKNKRLVSLLIGNTTRQLNTQQSNKYEWTVFAKTAPGSKPLSQYADKVEIKLHPTFNPNKIIYELGNNSSVELKRIGWGTFRIYITVFWKSLYEENQTQFFHDLDFQPLVQKQIGCYLHEKSN